MEAGNNAEISWFRERTSSRGEVDVRTTSWMCTKSPSVGARYRFKDTVPSVVGVQFSTCASRTVMSSPSPGVLSNGFWIFCVLIFWRVLVGI